MSRSLPLSVLLAAALAAACAVDRSREITALAAAARNGDVPGIVALAASGGTAVVNRADPGLNHWTPLLHAIHKGQLGSVAALIKAGADVNLAAPGGVTPLMMAVGNGHAGIVRILLAAGANPRVDGAELLATAVSGGALTDLDNPLLGRCNTDVVRLLIERAPDLRLEKNFRGHLAVRFARWNKCDEALGLARYQ